MDALSADVAGGDIGQYTEVLKRRWAFVLIMVLLGTVIGLLLAQARPESYRSSATVLVEAVGPIDRPGQAEVNLDTEIGLVQSEAVVETARRLLQTSTSSLDLADQVQAFVPPNTQLLEIRFDATDPVEAQRGAHAFAAAYIEARSSTARALSEARLERLNAELNESLASLQTVSTEIAAAPPGSAARAFAEGRRSVLVNQISQLQARITPLRQAATRGGVIVKDAQRPTRAAGPDQRLFVASGLLGGLLLAMLALLPMTRFERRVRSAGQIRNQLRLPVISDLSHHRSSGRLLDLAPAPSPIGQSFAQMHNVLEAMLPPGRRTVLLAPISPNTGSSAVAAQLALTVARADAAVVLIACRADSTASDLLECPAEPGLADLLRKEHGLRNVLHRGDNAFLAICPPGAALAEHYARFSSSGLREPVREVQSIVDFVFLEAPPLEEGAQAQALATLADAVLVIAEVGRTHLWQLEDARLQFDRMGVKIAGAVLVARSPSRPKSRTRVSLQSRSQAIVGPDP
jgi:capsular polysaccharide biosynthesis protein